MRSLLAIPRRRARPPVTALAAVAALALGAAPAGAQDDAPLPPATQAEAPAHVMTMSVGGGTLIRLPRAMTGVFVADDKVADVQVKGSTAVYVFAKAAGQTSIYATDRSGAVVWSTDVRVGANLADVGRMLRLAMPENDITATPMSGAVLLTGTVLGPKDAEEAQHLAEQLTGNAVLVLSKLKVATPQQVNLQVKIAEVNRTLLRQIGVNILTRDNSGTAFSIAQGTAGSITTNSTPPSPTNPRGLTADGTVFGQKTNAFAQLAGTALGLAGHAFGADFLSSLQLNEANGLVTTLAEPNLTALSGETASFLAGGEIPIPESQGFGTVSITFKQYGVSLAFTPTVLSGGRIMLRVRPEVSQLSDAGAVKLNNFTVPAFITRRAETTVELGSGQSFAIGGLLQNSRNNSVNKAPLLGDLPIIGALFRSNSFQNNETELVIVVTPYLVKGVDANRIALPTDGYRSPITADRVLLGRDIDGTNARRPVPRAAGAGAARP